LSESRSGRIVPRDGSPDRGRNVTHSWSVRGGKDTIYIRVINQTSVVQCLARYFTEYSRIVLPPCTLTSVSVSSQAVINPGITRQQARIEMLKFGIPLLVFLKIVPFSFTRLIGLIFIYC
jgi:hypothetical protein